MASTTRPTIGWDARLAGQRHAGIGRYIENLLIELPQTNLAVNWHFFFHDQSQAAPILAQIPNQEHLTVSYTPIRHYSFAEQTRWLKSLLQAKLTLLHVPHFNIPLGYFPPLVVTIHDLLWHQQIGPQATTLPTSTYYLKYLAYRLVTHQALTRAKKIFVPAETIKDTIYQYFPNLKTELVVTSEGLSSEFSDLPSQPAVSKINHRQLLYVGSLYPHKNINLVLQALIQRPNLQLKIVGARDVFLERTKELVNQYQLQSQIKFTGYLTDSELITQLQQSLALVQPSFSEGFGLTGVEAMAAGTPVLASKIKIFQEIYRQAPLYFDPQNLASFLAAVDKVSQPQQRAQAQQKGWSVAKQYRWSKVAQLLATHYQSILNHET